MAYGRWAIKDAVLFVICPQYKLLVRFGIEEIPKRFYFYVRTGGLSSTSFLLLFLFILILLHKMRYCLSVF